MLIRHLRGGVNPGVVEDVGPRCLCHRPDTPRNGGTPASLGPGVRYNLGYRSAKEDGGVGGLISVEEQVDREFTVARLDEASGVPGELLFHGLDKAGGDRHA